MRRTLTIAVPAAARARTVNASEVVAVPVLASDLPPFALFAESFGFFGFSTEPDSPGSLGAVAASNAA